MRKYLVLAIGLIVLGLPTNQKAFFWGSSEKVTRNKGVDKNFVKALAERFYETSKKSLIALGMNKQDLSFLLTQDLDEDPVTKHLVERIIIPDNAPVYMVGDLHGDIGPIEALMSALHQAGFCDLNEYQLHPDKDGRMPYIVFFGDYIDRGSDEFKVLDRLERLKSANPVNVYLLRGNHETLHMMRGGSGSLFESFHFDLLDFFKDDTSADAVEKKFLNAFEMLPSVLVIDRKNALERRIVCMHGAPEFKFNEFGIMSDEAIPSIVPSQDKVKIMDPFAQTSDKVGEQQYLWNNLRLDNDPSPFVMIGNKGYWIGGSSLKLWLDAQKAAVYFGAHQQEDTAYGESKDKSYKLFSEGPVLGVGCRVGWPVQAFKLNVAPRGGYDDKKRYKDRYYTDYGTFIYVDPVKKNGVFEYNVVPIYFDPDTYKLIAIADMEKKIGRPIEIVTLNSFID